VAVAVLVSLAMAPAAFADGAVRLAETPKLAPSV
jgi:hypothetical protein